MYNEIRLAAKDQVNVNLWSFLKKRHYKAASAIFSFPRQLSLIANVSFYSSRERNRDTH
jgi:hypothetical protein